jgi:nickel superoxide dismutase
MKKIWLLTLALLICWVEEKVMSHCQMPCGIYHDEMVFSEIDQYVETMVKAMSMLNEGKFDTVQDRNTFVRWVMQKEESSDHISHLISTYFLQQKIKPGEDDTLKKLVSAHRLLCSTVAIKQHTDLKIVDEFAGEWEKFKLMFHVEGYACKVEMLRIKAREAKQKALEEAHHDHDYDHDHDHSH